MFWLKELLLKWIWTAFLIILSDSVDDARANSKNTIVESANIILFCIFEYFFYLLLYYEGSKDQYTFTLFFTLYFGLAFINNHMWTMYFGCISSRK